MNEDYISPLLKSFGLSIESCSPRLPARMEGDSATLFGLLRSSYLALCAGRGAEYADNPVTVSALEAAVRWLLGKSKPWLLVTGCIGCGKTTLAFSLANMCNTMVNTRNSATTPQWQEECGHSIDRARLFATARPFAKRSAKDLAYLAELEPQKFYSVSHCDQLVIDDIGSESCSVKRYGTELSPVAETIFIRYEKLLTTLLTTNLSMNQIGQRYGLRVLDRLEEMCEIVEMKIQSFRH